MADEKGQQGTAYIMEAANWALRTETQCLSPYN